LLLRTLGRARAHARRVKHIRLRDLTGGVDTALLRRGRPASGVVTSIEIERTLHVGTDEYRVCSVQVRVHLDGERPYLATVRQRIPAEMIATLASGRATVAVRVDPVDHETIAIDLGGRYGLSRAVDEFNR
jgi:hypothetical protein